MSSEANKKFVSNIKKEIQQKIIQRIKILKHSMMKTWN